MELQERKNNNRKAKQGANMNKHYYIDKINFLCVLYM